MIRSLLFAPANRLDLATKFPETGADCVVIDFEGGTPAAERPSARARLGRAVASAAAAADGGAR
jgi:citrate lyase subunit beta/citryl-CoA lyase